MGDSVGSFPLCRQGQGLFPGTSSRKMPAFTLQTLVCLGLQGAMTVAPLVQPGLLDRKVAQSQGANGGAQVL